MEKVIVNNVVAGWIERRKKEDKSDWLYEVVMDIKSDKVLQDQNIDIVTLAKAIQYGYEVPYEFKDNDLVYCVELNRILEIGTDRSSGFMNSDNQNKAYTYKLICKAENREDLKVVSNGSI